MAYLLSTMLIFSSESNWGHDDDLWLENDVICQIDQKSFIEWWLNQCSDKRCLTFLCDDDVVDSKSRMNDFFRHSNGSRLLTISSNWQDNLAIFLQI